MDQAAWKPEDLAIAKHETRGPANVCQWLSNQLEQIGLNTFWKKDQFSGKQQTPRLSHRLAREEIICRTICSRVTFTWGCGPDELGIPYQARAGARHIFGASISGASMYSPKLEWYAAAIGWTPGNEDTLESLGLHFVLGSLFGGGRPQKPHKGADRHEILC